jgi:putative FmdB family regulatory protein
MSIYEYKCRDCHRQFVIEESITKHKEASIKCPKCGSKAVERHWEAVNVQTSKKS